MRTHPCVCQCRCFQGIQWETHQGCGRHHPMCWYPRMKKKGGQELSTSHLSTSWLQMQCDQLAHTPATCLCFHNGPDYTLKPWALTSSSSLTLLLLGIFINEKSSIEAPLLQERLLVPPFLLSALIEQIPEDFPRSCFDSQLPGWPLGHSIAHPSANSIPTAEYRAHQILTFNHATYRF